MLCSFPAINPIMGANMLMLGRVVYSSRALIAVALATMAMPASALANTTIDFEEFAGQGNVAVSDQYQPLGVEFTNTYAFSSGNTEYPPHSGVTEIADGFYSKNINATFSVPVNMVSGYYTAPNGMTLEAYNSLGNLIGSETFGDVYNANAAFSISTAADISKLVFVDLGPFAEDEAVDDLTFGLSAVSAAPEIGTWLMMILGFGLVGAAMRSAHRKSKPSFTANARSFATA